MYGQHTNRLAAQVAVLETTEQSQRRNKKVTDTNTNLKKMSIYTWEDMSDEAVITFFDSAGMLLSTLSDLNMSPPEVKKINRDKALDIFQDLCLTSTLDDEDEFGQVYLAALEEADEVPEILVKDTFITVISAFRRAFSSNKILKEDYEGGRKQQVLDILAAFREAFDDIKDLDPEMLMAAGAYMDETGEGDSTPGIEKFNAAIKEKMGLEA